MTASYAADALRHELAEQRAVANQLRAEVAMLRAALAASEATRHEGWSLYATCECRTCSKARAS